MSINRYYPKEYEYEELRAAVKADASEDNVNALGEWFESYGQMYWNGEYFNADGMRIYPVYAECDEDEINIELLGYRAE